MAPVSIFNQMIERIRRRRISFASFTSQSVKFCATLLNLSPFQLHLILVFCPCNFLRLLSLGNSQGYWQNYTMGKSSFYGHTDPPTPKNPITNLFTRNPPTQWGPITPGRRSGGLKGHPSCTRVSSQLRDERWLLLIIGIILFVVSGTKVANCIPSQCKSNFCCINWMTFFELGKHFSFIIWS